jgi:hypothetical protein
MSTIQELEEGVIEHVPEEFFSTGKTCCRPGDETICPACPIGTLSERLHKSNREIITITRSEIYDPTGSNCYNVAMWNNKVLEAKKLKAILE